MMRANDRHWTVMIWKRKNFFRLLVAAAVALVLVLWMRVQQATDKPSADVSTGDCRCGGDRSDAGKSIVFPVAIQACRQRYPFVVNLMRQTTLNHVCTGILYNPEVVVLPAACVDHRVKQSEKFPYARVGSFDLHEHEGPEKEEVRKTIRKVIHPNFTGNPKMGFDIAMLFLENPIEQHDYINGTTGVESLRKKKRHLNSIGWFKSSPIGAPSRTLQTVTRMAYVEPDECKKAHGEVPEGVICAKTAPRVGCEWDRGALLLSCSKDFDDSLVGLASYKGDKCNNSPYMYTHVGEFIDWIENYGEGDPMVEFSQEQTKEDDEL